MLNVSRLSKTFGHIVALDAVSLSVRDGEVLGLIGPNGAGKTTLFECLAGLMPVESGCVEIAGRGLTTGERGHHLFYVPDGIAPWPAQTVRWALDFTLRFFGGDGARLQDVVARLALQPLLETRLSALSKGQRKRATMAIGLLTPQPILLVDEPFDGLDLRQGREMGDALREHARAGRTLFLSIHQIQDAARVCDRFVLLSAGTIRGEGTLDELRGRVAQDHAPPAASPPSLEEVFLALT
jgi:ABC-2 type transport system ATP-binding protein